MPDAPIRTPAPRPMDWGDAFAALPMEAPSASGWPRVAAALDARRRSRWPLWLATAAALGLVALVPLQRWLRPDGIDARPLAASSAPSQRVGPAAIEQTAARSLAAAGHHPGEGGNPAARKESTFRPATSRAMDAPAAAVVARSRPSGNGGRRIATASPTRGRTDAFPGQGQPPADAPAAADVVSPSRGIIAIGDSAFPIHGIETVDPTMTSGLTTTESTTPELDRLYAESAQLEALVALARDDRMSTGTVAALGGELQAQVARIDAALVEPSLAPEQRLGLWRDRVQALRELAGFETTQRLLAARGEQYDGMLVSVD